MVIFVCLIRYTSLCYVDAVTSMRTYVFHFAQDRSNLKTSKTKSPTRGGAFILAYPIGYASLRYADTVNGMRTYVFRFAQDRLNLRTSKTKAPHKVELSFWPAR